MDSRSRKEMVPADNTHLSVWFRALAGFLVHLAVFLHSLMFGKKSPANPWGGLSLEWESATPPIEHNFAHEPVVRYGPYDFDDHVPPQTEPGEFPLPEPSADGGHH